MFLFPWQVVFSGSNRRGERKVSFYMEGKWKNPLLGFVYRWIILLDDAILTCSHTYLSAA